MKTSALLPLLFVVLAGCSSLDSEYKKVAKIHVGMTRQELVETFGEPIKSVHNGSVEVLSYQLTDTRSRMGNPSPKQGYYFVITHERVEAFGKE